MSNTVGSREIIPCILRARKNLVLKISQIEKDILIGSILGDGYITKLGKIQLEQGDKQYKYLKWKHKQLARISYGGISFAKRKKLSGKVTYSYRFWTRQYFRTWRRFFYPNGRKEIPSSITYLLSPLTLSVWYMDDGCLRSENSVIFSTERFSMQSLENIRKAFQKRYKIDVTVRKNKRLYLGKTSTGKFLKVISLYIVPSMRYKLP